MTHTALKPLAFDFDLDQMLCFAVYRAEHAFTRVYRSALEPLGLTYPQFLVMRLLWRQDGLSVGEISARLGLDSGTVTPILKRLALMGLVNRERRSDDERRVDIRLTAAGRALKEKSQAAMACVDEAVGMDGDAVRATLATLNALTERLEQAVTE